MPIIIHLSQLNLAGTYSYTDYLTWQFDEWIELIKGKVQLMRPAPRRAHQEVSTRLSGLLFGFLERKPVKYMLRPLMYA